MKVYKHDWDHSSTEDINVLRDLMANNIAYQDDGEVGIFWYDPTSEELFGVKSANVNDVPFYKSTIFNTEVKTCRPLHFKVWEREYYRGKDRRFSGDYTKVPRGRVFYVKDEGFVVVVGDWIDSYPEAKPIILAEFNLPSDTKFKQDAHWNIGHGWSDKFM